MPKVAIPADFLCPITHELMKDPVSTVDGQIYERKAIEKWLETHDTSPLTGAHLESKKLVVIPFVKNQIEAFFKKSGLCTKETFEKMIAAGDEKTFAHLHYLEDYLESKDSNGLTPLERAVQSDKVGLVELLLAEGIDCEAKDTHGMTPLAQAAYEGHGAVIEVLLKAGADREAKDTTGRTPLAQAAYEGHVAAIEVLLKAGADREAKDTDGMTPLAQAAYYGHVAAIEVLLKAGADREAKGTRGMTPLAQAAYEGHVAAIEVLLKAGADREAKDTRGRTPLAQAAYEGHVAAIEVLLKAGADREAKATHGMTPLAQAAYYGHVAAIEVLLKAGADREAKDMDRRTPLAQAAYKGHGAAIEALLRADVETETVDVNGNSPLHQAAGAPYPPIQGTDYEQALVILLNHGANPLTRNHQNKTASEVAMDASHKDLAELIQTHAQAIMAQLPRQLVTLRKTVASQAERIAHLEYLFKALQAKLEMPHVEESKKSAASSSSFSLNVAASDPITSSSAMLEAIHADEKTSALPAGTLLVTDNSSFSLETKDQETTSSPIFSIDTKAKVRRHTPASMPFLSAMIGIANVFAPTSPSVMLPTTLTAPSSPRFFSPAPSQATSVTGPAPLPPVVTDVWAAPASPFDVTPS